MESAAHEESVTCAEERYWIGIVCSEPDRTLRRQPGLTHGVVVDEVFPDSPATIAGVEVDDIIFELAGSVVQSPDQFSTLIQNCQAEDVELRVLRGINLMSLRIRPAVRPMDDAQRDPPNDDTGIFVEGDNSEFIEPRNVYALVTHNAKIIVRVQKESAATALVEYGGRQWKIAAEEIDSLPVELRSDVQDMFRMAKYRPLESPEVLGPSKSGKLHTK